MKKSLAIFTGLILAKTGIFASSAAAVDVNVPFTGELAGSCTFGTANPGTITFTDSQNFTGTGGSVLLTCNTPTSKLDVTNVAHASGTTVAGYSFTAEANSPNMNAPATLAGTAQDFGVNSETVSVSMTGSNTDVITAGNYTFNVTLTAAPN